MKPAAERLAGWHDVSRQLKAVGYCPHHHDERHYEARLVLARRLFIERCCAEGQAVTLFEDLAGMGGGGRGGGGVPYNDVQHLMHVMALWVQKDYEGKI